MAKGELAPLEVRDGVISAYVVICRLNQTEGNSAVGLKQEEKGLFQHISGFMEAIFGERRFNFKMPTIDQIAEVKIMLDGMTRISAMPDKLQMALNEIYDLLVARGKGMPAIISPAVMDLLEVEGEPGMGETKKTPAKPVSRRRTTSPGSRDPKLAKEKSPKKKELKINLDSIQVPEDFMSEEKPSSEKDLFSNKRTGPASDPEETETKKTSDAEHETIELQTDPDQESPRLQGASLFGEPSDPEETETKKTSDAEYETIELQTDPDQESPRLQGASVSGEPEPEPEPISKSDAKITLRVRENDQPDSEFKTAAQNILDSDPDEVPSKRDQESSQIQARHSVLFSEELDDMPEDVSKGGSHIGVIMLFVLGLILGVGGSYYLMPKIKFLKINQASAEAGKELAGLKNIIEQQQAASQKPPAKPQYIKIGKGVLIYWLDTALTARKYHFYKGRGKKDKLEKIDSQPRQKNLIWLKNIKRGTWRYAVTALDYQGQETQKSDVLTLKFPLKK